MIGPGRGQWRRLLSVVERADEQLVGPELLWSESHSALHEIAWRGHIGGEDLRDALQAMAEAPIGVRRPRWLRARACEIADRMGWAKTYDAEYCALAELLGCELVTTDGRLHAASQRLGYVFTPAEMAARL